MRKCNLDVGILRWNKALNLTSCEMSEYETGDHTTKSHALLYPFDKPIKSLYCRWFVASVLFACFHFKIIRKSLYLLKQCLWLSDRIVAYTFVQKKSFTYRKGFFNSVKHCCSFLVKLKELTSWQMIRNGIHVVCLHFVVKCSDVEGLGCVW